MYGSGVLHRIFVAVLAAVHGVGAPSQPEGPLARPAPPPLIYPADVDTGPFRRPLTAASYIAIDLKAGTVLMAKGSRTRRPIASLTKVMTGVLAAEAGDPNHLIRVPRAATQVEPNRDDLVAGRHYTRRLLEHSALMISANDSAYALGWDIGGNSIGRFYNLMNDAASQLGMSDTHYGSANGLDDVHNWSSARDQALVARYALADATFRKIVGRRTMRVRWAAPVHLKVYRNHNRMLFSYGGTYGVKTGFTTRAGACLVVAVHRGGHDVLAVLLDSKGIWADMPRLVGAALRRAS